MEGRNWNIVDNLYIIKDDLISQRIWIKLNVVYKENPIILLFYYKNFIWSYTLKDKDEKLSTKYEEIKTWLHIYGIDQLSVLFMRGSRGGSEGGGGAPALKNSIFWNVKSKLPKICIRSPPASYTNLGPPSPEKFSGSVHALRLDSCT